MTKKIWSTKKIKEHIIVPSLQIYTFIYLNICIPDFLQKIKLAFVSIPIYWQKECKLADINIPISDFVNKLNLLLDREKYFALSSESVSQIAYQTGRIFTGVAEFLTVGQNFYQTLSGGLTYFTTTAVCRQKGKNRNVQNYSVVRHFYCQLRWVKSPVLHAAMQCWVISFITCYQLYMFLFIKHHQVNVNIAVDS